jgi:DNA polymerase-3 subunit epsilon
LQTGAGRCFHSQIKKCKGVCCQKELPEQYNARVNEALAMLGGLQNDMLIEGQGRNKNEKSVVVIKDGVYKGFGFVSKQKKITNEQDFSKELQPQKDNRDIQRILRQYFRQQEKIEILSKK